MDTYTSIDIYEETQMDFWNSFSEMEMDNVDIDLLLEDVDVAEDLFGDVEIYM